MKIKQRGFTLVEIMIVVAIVAILATIAIPNYTKYVRDARRGETGSELTQLVGQMEIFFSRNRTYTTDLGLLKGLAAGSSETLQSQGGGHYTYSSAACTNSTINTCATITATVNAGSSQAEDTNCLTFALSTNGQAEGRDRGCWD